MIDFTQKMTGSFAYWHTYVIHRFSFLSLFLFILLIPLGTSAQCYHQMNKEDLDGYDIDLASLNKTNNAYWIAFTAQSEKFYVELYGAENAQLSLYEASTLECNSNGKKIDIASLSKANKFLASYKALEIDQNYLLKITNTDKGRFLIKNIYNKISNSGNRISVGKTRTQYGKAKAKQPIEAPVQSALRKPNNRFAKASKPSTAKRKKYEITKAELQEDINWLKQKIEKLELEPDYSQEEIQKMKTALVNWQARLSKM